MRDLQELELNEGGEPVDRAPPTDQQIRAFEAHFGVELPQDYLLLLRHSNGGHPLLDSFEARGQEAHELWGINRFYFLNGDHADSENLWWNAEAWQPTLGPKIVPIADNGGGDLIVLSFTTVPPSVQVCVHEEEFELLDVADSFSEFIDMLHEDPDLLEDENEDEE